MRRRLASLRAQLVGIIGLAVLPMVAYSAYYQVQARAQAELEARQRVQGIADLGADQESLLIQTSQQLLATLARLPGMHTGGLNCQPLLAGLLQQSPHYINLSLLDADGTPLCSALPYDRAAALAPPHWFQQVLATRAFVIGDYQAAAGGGPATLTLAQPILDNAGQVQSVIAVVLDLQWLNDFAAAAGLPPGASIFVIDEHSTLLFRSPDPEHMTGQPLPEQQLLRVMRDQPIGQTTLLTGVDGTQRVYGFARLHADSPTDVMLAVGLPAAQVFADANRDLLSNAAMLLVVGGVTLGLVLILMERSVLRPIQHLVAQTRRLAAGDLSTQPPPPAAAELETLSAALDQLAQTLAAQAAAHEADLAALAASEGRYRALFEQAGDGIFLSDAQGRCLDVNASGARLLGAAREAVLAAPRAAWTVETPLPALTPDQTVVLDGSLRHQDGSLIPVEINITRLPDGRWLEVTREVGARRRLEAALRSAETFLTALLEQFPAGVMVMDVDQRVTLVNRGWEALYQLKRAQVLGRFAAEFLAAEAAHDLQTIHAQVLAARRPILYERMAGARQLQLIVYPLMEAAGQITAVVSISLDITERVTAERAARQREEQFRLISELTSDFAYALRLEADGVWMREWGLGAFERISGYSALEMETVPDWFALVHPDDQAPLAEFFRARLAAGTPGSQEFRVVAKSGAIRHIRGYVQPSRDESGQWRRLLGSGQDITERRQTEAVLQLTQFTMDHAAEAIYWIALDGRLVAVNEAACRMLGFTRGELLAKTVADLDSQATPDWWQNHLADLQSRGARRLEAAHLARDGRRVAVEISSNYVEFRGQALVCAFVRDITERRRAEAALLQLNAELEQRVTERTARLEAINTELEAFSYSVSHDLRAPLRAITGFAGILARRQRAALDEEGRHYLDNIVTAGERMSQLIDDLLTYSRLGRRAVRAHRVSLADVLAEVVAELEPRITEAGAEIRVAPDLPAVLAETGLLRQIFINLLENALVYHQPDRPPRISVTARREAGRVVVAVTDNGLGIAPEYHAQIFEMFQRLQSDDDFPGTGLGLAMVRKAAGLLGGDVGVDSAAGAGSTFWVRLTVDDAEPAEKQP